MNLNSIQSESASRSEVFQTIHMLGSLIGVDVQEKDISTSQSFPKPTSYQQPSAIIMKFVRREKSEEFYCARSSSKTKSTKDLRLTVRSHNKICITESLIKRNKELFKEYLSAKYELGYTDSYAPTQGKSICERTATVLLRPPRLSKRLQTLK